MLSRELKIIIICCLIIFVFKLAIYQSELGNAERISHLGDHQYYIETSKWIIGMNNTETPRTWQYPPLYPILITPSLSLPTVPYLIIMKNIFAVLSFIPLFLLTKRYLNIYLSGILSSTIVLTSIAYTTRFGFKAPNALSAMLFCIFMFYFFYADYSDNKKYFYLASFSFGLLIFTKYVFFFLLPMIIIWLMIEKERPLIIKLKSIFMFSIIPCLLFSIWTIRNIVIHGLSLRGIFGGYTSLLTNDKHFWYKASDKLTSITTDYVPNLIIIYFLIFIIAVLFIRLYLKTRTDYFTDVYNRRDIRFHYLMILTFLIFLLVPAMTYWDDTLNWRYLSLIVPPYLLLGIIPFSKIIWMYLRDRFKKPFFTNPVS